MPRTDVLIVGGSLGGAAAALAAGRAGASVLLVAEGDWLGGQLTSQGVCTPDENAWVERGGATASYQALREAIRAHYRQTYRLSAAGLSQEHFNAGSCWVSRISGEPAVAQRVLREMLAAHPSVQVECGATAVGSAVVGDRIQSVTFRHRNGVSDVAASVVLDATDLGDLLPLVGAEHRLGAESVHETGEPDAPREPRPEWIQPFTYCVALELRPRGEDHTIPPPAAYGELRALQDYHVLDGAMKGMFGELGWWEYRRVIAARNFDDPAFPCDVAMVNTGSNDFKGGRLPVRSRSPGALLTRARRATLGYVYWLQTECPREDEPGRAGYPELRLRGDWFGTNDGLAPSPYIREARRICAMETVYEHDIVAADGAGCPHQRTVRSRLRADSVGIGHYWLDIHKGGTDEPARFLETRPYQIPLGALVPVRLRNLVASCKNIGLTHLSSAAYRLHPVEWNIGEAAGALAAYVVRNGLEPHDVLTREGVRRRFQSDLLDVGVPLYWWGDLVPGTPVWRAAQVLAVRGTWPEEDRIEFLPDDAPGEALPLSGQACTTRAELALALIRESERA